MLDKYIRRIFHGICLIAAIVLVGRSMYHYSLNEDLTSTKYRDFNSEEIHIYPSISLCFGNIFDESKLNDIGTNSTAYIDFLKGRNYSQDLSSISYENVTLDPIEYLLGVELYQLLANKRMNPKQRYWYDHTNLRSSLDGKRLHLYIDQFNEWVGTIYKCITLDVPYIENEHLNRIVLVMKRSIFPEGKRPMFYSKNKQNLFMVSLAYPNQRIRFSNDKLVWPEEVTNGSYTMKFYVSTVEAMQYRNKYSKPCNTNWKEDDNEIRKRMIDNAKCIPSYWQMQYPMPYPKCSNPDEMVALYTDISWNDHINPCRTLSKTSWFDGQFPAFRYDELVDKKYLNSYFTARFYFPRKFYKEIKRVRAYDIETLIGNGGGYIGLCLGYSFLQLPTFLDQMFKKLRSF